MEKQEKQKPIWPVKHPVTQYNEDVKELAQKNGLKVIDERFCKNIDPKFLAKETPKLTQKKKGQLQKEHQEAAASQTGIGAGQEESE